MRGCASGTNPSRVDDIDPNEIESYDVVKGPAPSTLYGTAASNGVVVIKTKRGTPGPARFTAFAETGVIKDYNTYPTAYRGWRHSATDTSSAKNSRPDNGTQCFLTQTVRAPGDPQYCVQDSITAFNLFTDPDATPLGTGYRQQYGLQVSGGSDVARYFVSGEWEDERGVLRMPAFAWNRLVTTRTDGVPYEQFRPNARRGAHVRANVQANLTPKLDLAVQTGFISSSQRLPQTDNNTVGLLSNGFGGPGFKGKLSNPTCRSGHPCHGTGRVSSQSHRHMPNSMARRISEATWLLAWLGSRRTRSATTRNARSMTRRSSPAASASSSAASLMPSRRPAASS